MPVPCGVDSMCSAASGYACSSVTSLCICFTASHNMRVTAELTISCVKLGIFMKLNSRYRMTSCVVDGSFHFERRLNERSHGSS